MDKPTQEGGTQILVVEDDPDHRKALTEMLEQEGYQVTSAGEGSQAIEKLRWGLRPAAILLDMRMHVMNGWEFRRELEKDPALPSIPVLIMSGGPLKPKDLAGCADWITKPVNKEELLKKLEQATRKPS